MKLPRVPQLDIAPARMGHLLRLLNSGAVQAEQAGRYLHWEELRHRPPPEDVTSEEWWAAITLVRSQLARGFPLLDTKGTPFRFAMTDTAQRLAHEIDRDASGKLSLPEDVATPVKREQYVVSSLVEEAFRSSQLEGASTTREVAKEMVRTQRAPRTKSEQMIFNNYRAMEWARAHASDELTPALLFTLHRIVTDGTLDNPEAAGRLRLVDEPVNVIDETTGDVLHTPPKAGELAKRLEKLCQFANADTSKGTFVHPVVRSILVHFWLAYEHPFVDGNGRVARALFYWAMLHRGYWLTEFLSISRVIFKARQQYDRAFLYSESDRNDATYFVLHQLQVIQKAIADLHSYLARKSQEVRQLEDALRGRSELNGRQLELLNRALHTPNTHFTIAGHQAMSEVVYQTARTDLLKLVELGYFEQHKSGKRLTFTPAPDLERLIRPRRGRT